MQEIMLSKGLTKELGQLEQGMAKFWPNSTTLFCMVSNGQPYTSANLSMRVNHKLLVFGDKKLTSNQLRHMFITGYKDYMHHPASITQQQQVQHAIQGAAAMMLNTPEVWEHYDDMRGDRQLLVALAHWPHFQAFMEARDKELHARKDIDPLTYDFSSM